MVFIHVVSSQIMKTKTFLSKLHNVTNWDQKLSYENILFERKNGTIQFIYVCLLFLVCVDFFNLKHDPFTSLEFFEPVHK